MTELARPDVIVGSHPVVCMTYDELYKNLNEVFEQYSKAFKVESKPATPSE